jgi:hypothetical protein
MSHPGSRPRTHTQPRSNHPRAQTLRSPPLASLRSSRNDSLLSWIVTAGAQPLSLQGGGGADLTQKRQTTTNYLTSPSCWDLTRDASPSMTRPNSETRPPHHAMTSAPEPPSRDLSSLLQSHPRRKQHPASRKPTHPWTRAAQAFASHFWPYRIASNYFIKLKYHTV